MRACGEDLLLREQDALVDRCSPWVLSADAAAAIVVRGPGSGSRRRDPVFALPADAAQAGQGSHEGAQTAEARGAGGRTAVSAESLPNERLTVSGRKQMPKRSSMNWRTCLNLKNDSDSRLQYSVVCVAGTADQHPPTDCKQGNK